DGLMVADLEMQERMILDATPVPAEKRIAADEIDRPRDIAAAALGRDQQDILGHALADQAVEFPVQIGTAPFAAAGIQVEGKELVPDGFGEIRACQPVDLYAV